MKKKIKSETQNQRMMAKSELDKVAERQYRIALVRYITTTMGENTGDHESVLQLYVRAITWLNDQFVGLHANDSSNPAGPPPPPPGGH